LIDFRVLVVLYKGRQGLFFLVLFSFIATDKEIATVDEREETLQNEKL